jgi:hypothetical protein
VLIRVNAGYTIHVTYQLDRPALKTTPQVTRSEPERDARACMVMFTLTDGGTLKVTAESITPFDIDTCAVVTSAADHAETVLHDNAEIPRMPAVDPASMVDLYACAMLQPDHLALIDAYANTRADAGFADWFAEAVGQGSVQPGGVKAATRRITSPSGTRRSADALVRLKPTTRPSLSAGAKAATAPSRDFSSVASGMISSFVMKR